jgi:hypothetical protein
VVFYIGKQCTLGMDGNLETLKKLINESSLSALEVYLHDNKISEGIKFIDELSDYHELPANFYSLDGLTYELDGNFNVAKVYYEKAHQKQPDGLISTKGLERITHGKKISSEEKYSIMSFIEQPISKLGIRDEAV